MGSERRHTFLNDIIFKIVFGATDDRDLLRALINALLNLSGENRILDIEILNPHVEKRYVDEKGGVLDVKARDSAGRLYNIEVQVCDEQAYVPRALYYLTRLFSEQVLRGDCYDDLNKTIGISLLDFTLFDDRTELHSTYRFFEEEHHHRLTDLLEIHFIELVKFRRDKPHSLMTPFEKWLHLLKFGDIYESGAEPLPEALIQEEGIAMAFEKMKTAWASDELREWIEFREKARLDYLSGLEHARRKGKIEGKIEGITEGLQTAARRMLDQGMDPQTVRQIIGLDQAQ